MPDGPVPVPSLFGNAPQQRVGRRSFIIEGDCLFRVGLCGKKRPLPELDQSTCIVGRSVVPSRRDRVSSRIAGLGLLAQVGQKQCPRKTAALWLTRLEFASACNSARARSGSPCFRNNRARLMRAIPDPPFNSR